MEKYTKEQLNAMDKEALVQMLYNTQQLRSFGDDVQRVQDFYNVTEEFREPSFEEVTKSRQILR